MQQKPPPDAAHPLAPHLLENLDAVLRRLQERIAATRSPDRSPDHRLALVRLVEGVSLADWREIAARFSVAGWLALPVDEEDGVSLRALGETLEELAFQRGRDTLAELAGRRRIDRRTLVQAAEKHFLFTGKDAQ